MRTTISLSASLLAISTACSPPANSDGSVAPPGSDGSTLDRGGPFEGDGTGGSSAADSSITRDGPQALDGRATDVTQTIDAGPAIVMQISNAAGQEAETSLAVSESTGILAATWIGYAPGASAGDYPIQYRFS